MKKVIYIITMALCLSACCSVGEIGRKESDIKKEKIHLRGESTLYVCRFEYDGHKYVMFYNVGASVNGFVHDPDCPCHKQYVNKGGNKQETSDYPDWW